MSEPLPDFAEAVPPRSLLDRLPGPVWGIDPSTERISLGIVAPATGARVIQPAPARIEAHTLSLAQGGQHPGVRLARAESALCQWFTTLARLNWPSPEGKPPHLIPVAVAVEEPFGGGHTAPPVQLQMMCGVVLAAIWRQFGTRTEVLMKGKGANIGVPPGTWKAQAMGVGNGRAKKPAISAWAERACGWPGAGPTRPQDEADALGIATWAALQVASRGQKDASDV